MDENAAQFVKILSELPDDDTSLVDELYDAVELLDSSDTVQEVFPAIFSFFELHPAADLGSPGPLVHLTEKAYPGGYEDQLLASLARKPVHSTVWMANRLLNDDSLAEPLRSRLQAAIKDTTVHPLADDAAKQIATQFIDHQILPRE
jgi:hypothetical protein